MNWKKALLVALVVLLVLIGIPVLMPGMHGAMGCPQCGAAMAGGPWCTLVAILSGLAIALSLFAQRLRYRRDRLFDLLRAAVFERPPQLA